MSFPLYWTYSRSTSAVRNKQTPRLSSDPNRPSGVPHMTKMSRNTQRTYQAPDWEAIGSGLESRIKNYLTASKASGDTDMAEIIAMIPDDTSQAGGRNVSTPQGTAQQSVVEQAAEKVPETVL